LRVVVGNMIYCLLDCFEITRPIRGDDDLSRKRASVRHKKAQEAQKS